MSPSEVHSGIKRATQAKLYNPHTKSPNIMAFEEFIVHGLKYVFPPVLGPQTRGIPTGYAAPPLNMLISSGNELPPVWPYNAGNSAGFEFQPLYKSVPEAVQTDEQLYELLALIDAIREGKAREVEVAVNEIKERFKKYGCGKNE